MRVAFVTNRPTHYRAPIFRLLPASTQSEIEFFFTASTAGRWWNDSQPYDVEGLRYRNDVSALKLLHAIQGGRYDCVITSLGGRAHLLATVLSVERMGLPLVLWVDMWHYPKSFIHAVAHPLFKHTIRRADAIVSCGPHVTRFIHSQVGRTADLVEMPNAIDNAMFQPHLGDAEASATRSAFGLTASWLACFVGRLEREKGLDILLRAIAELPSEFGLVVVGSGSHDKEVLESAAQLGIEGRVACIGWIEQSELPRIYRACDAVVIPSRSTRLIKETWGLVANEAMCAQVPVVATTAVGAVAGGLIRHEETGLVVPELDSTALAQALQRLSRDPLLAKRLQVRSAAAVSAYTFEAASTAFATAVGVAIRRRRPRVGE